jgi:hypothetical protein
MDFSYDSSHINFYNKQKTIQLISIYMNKLSIK